MLDGRPLIDVHLHAARLPTLKLPWDTWAHDFGDREVLDAVYDADGTVDPGRVRRLPGRPRASTSRCCWPSTARR